MRASLLAFESGLQSLRHYVDGLVLENHMLAAVALRSTRSKTLQAHAKWQRHAAQSPSKRRFEYASVIVSLYGYVEQFIEELVKEYLVWVSSICPEHDELPAEIRDNHVRLSIQLINKLDYQRYRALSVGPIVSNLNSCLTRNGRYALNAEAFAYHSANFRRDSIDALFSQVGITAVSGKIVEDADFAQFLRGGDPAPAVLTIDSAFEKVNELAERRNDVAHGQPADILSHNMLLEYVAYFLAYGRALHGVIRRSAVPLEVRRHGIPFGRPLAVHNNQIVCFEIANISISCGDWLVAKSAHRDPSYFDGEIQSIQVDHQAHDSVRIDVPTKIALRVLYPAKQNQTFFLLPKATRML